MKNPEKKCKVCRKGTRVVFNIDFKAVPICESCARTIFMQEARDLAQRCPWMDKASKVPRTPHFVAVKSKKACMSGITYAQGTPDCCRQSIFDGAEQMFDFITGR